MPESPLDLLWAPTIRFEDMRIGQTAKADGFFMLVAPSRDSSSNSSRVFISGDLVQVEWIVVCKTSLLQDDGSEIVCLQELVEVEDSPTLLYKPTGCFFVPHKYLPNCISLMEFKVCD